MMANFWPPSLNNENIFFLIKYINGSEIQFCNFFCFFVHYNIRRHWKFGSYISPNCKSFSLQARKQSRTIFLSNKSQLFKVFIFRIIWLSWKKKTPLKSKKRGNYIWGFILILILKDSEEELILFCGNTAGEQWDFHLYANRLKTHRFKNLKRDLIP